MKIIEPSYEILTDINGQKILKDIEMAARTCYKSEDKISNGSEIDLVQKLIARGHGAMIEFADIAVRFVCNRGFTHEMVRHRLCSFAQESTRYCNYSKDKFGNELTFIKPAWYDDEKTTDDMRSRWEIAMVNAEISYLELTGYGMAPQDARGVLPIDIKTEIVVKANVREWIHIFKMRTAIAAHPSMKQLMRPLQAEFRNKIPIVFE